MNTRFSKIFLPFLIVTAIFLFVRCEDTTDEDLTGIPIEFISIPSGPFTYSEADTEMNIDYNYSIMKHEVTNYQFIEYLEEAMDDGIVYIETNEDGEEKIYGYYEGDEYIAAGDVVYLDLSGESCHINWSGHQFFVNRNFKNNPATYVTWYGASAFAQFKGWRLPTQLEWEKAARGNTGNTYPWGEDDPDCDKANFVGCNDATIHVGDADGVSTYGIFDLSGNVWEWCEDLYLEDWDIYILLTRIVKGGGWDSIDEYLKTWQWDNHFASEGLANVGFRCIRMD